MGVGSELCWDNDGHLEIFSTTKNINQLIYINWILDIDGPDAILSSVQKIVFGYNFHYY